MRTCIVFLFLVCIGNAGFCQKPVKRTSTSKRLITKADFMHTWNLSEIRNGRNQFVTKKVNPKTLQFTADSVFIITAENMYKGTWLLEKGQIQVNVPECAACNYKWSVISDPDMICFRIGDNNSKLECFKRKE